MDGGAGFRTDNKKRKKLLRVTKDGFKESDKPSHGDDR